MFRKDVDVTLSWSSVLPVVSVVGVVGVVGVVDVVELPVKAVAVGGLNAWLVGWIVHWKNRSQPMG
jgi:hypothetical protein